MYSKWPIATFDVLWPGSMVSQSFNTGTRSKWYFQIVIIKTKMVGVFCLYFCSCFFKPKNARSRANKKKSNCKNASIY